ncbi:MAG TPA: FecR domain-containing protein [Lacunisphaera sp.]
MTTPTSSPDKDPVAQAAAEWMIRHDRGLTAAEQDEFSLWLAADPHHPAAWAEHRWGWDELDRLAGLQTSVHAMPDPDLLAPKQARAGQRWAWPVLAAAAAVAVGIFILSKPVAPGTPAGGVPVVRSLALIEQREMPDGSVIELNRGAVITEHYTAGERRVRLERGEAHFKVAKDAARPFFVEAGGVAVRAVGTAFNVRLDPASVEVLVTEGKVSVAAPSAPGVEPVIPLMGMNERTVVSLAPAAPAPQVTVVPPAEIEARLAWQPRLLDFTDAPLAEIVAEFNRRNPVRLVLAAEALRTVRLSATFRSDNVEGFVRLMESDFGMKAEWRGGDEIVLTGTP